MDVIANPSAVFGRVVVAEYVQALQFAGGHLCNVGHQIVGDAFRVFANQSALVRADRVEVAQQRDLPLVVRFIQILQNLFDDQLGAAIRVGGRGWKVLFDRYAVRIAVDGRGRAENNILYLVTLHRLKQVDAAGDVVFVVVQRDLRRLPHRLESGEVDHGLYVVFGEDSVQSLAVADVGLVETEIFAGYLFYPFQRIGGAVAEVVDDDDLMAGLQQFHTGVAADVAGAACAEDCF